MPTQPQIITVTIDGMTPVSFCQPTREKEKGESGEEYELAILKEKVPTDSSGHVYLSADRFKKAVIAAAYLAGQKIPGRGNKRWGSLFATGIAAHKGFALPLHVDEVEGEWLSLHSRPGSGKETRVPKFMPTIMPWGGTFSLVSFLPEIGDAVFLEHMELAGYCIGIGRWRPEKKGSKGTFAVKSITWAPHKPTKA